jgi:hypothetical protein
MPSEAPIVTAAGAMVVPSEIHTVLALPGGTVAFFAP